MDLIAKAVVLAVQYIADKRDESTEDNDLALLEQVAHVLSQATATEKESLIRAAGELGLPEWPEQVGITS